MSAVNPPLPGCDAGYHLPTCGTVGCGGCAPGPIGYAFEPADFAQLKQICSALFAPEILSPDARRDLANRMHVLLLRAVALDDQHDKRVSKRWLIENGLPIVTTDPMKP